MDLVTIASELSAQVGKLNFGPPVFCVYNPLSYAWQPHRMYLERYGQAPKEILLVGMNPGPWGMVQTGVPFGDVVLVRDWLGILAPVERPAREHPARPVLGFACRRREVSGMRLWGWAKQAYGTPERFFTRFFVLNYCPLAFLRKPEATSPRIGFRRKPSGHWLWCATRRSKQRWHAFSPATSSGWGDSLRTG